MSEETKQAREKNLAEANITLGLGFDCPDVSIMETVEVIVNNSFDAGYSRGKAEASTHYRDLYMDKAKELENVSAEIERLNDYADQCTLELAAAMAEAAIESAKSARLTAALEFYANKENYLDGVVGAPIINDGTSFGRKTIIVDDGARAREALAGETHE